MLAGLIFAIEEATDRPGALAATLPFGGMTLLEYQVRLLAGAGAEKMLVAVGRMTPGLLNAVNRASARGLSVEVVRSAEEAAERVPDEARVIVIADALVTTDSVIAAMAQGEGGFQDDSALLVTDDPNSPAAIERLDARDSWAGIARVSGGQLAEIAQMPADYDFQSALLRVAVQAGAEHVLLTPEWAQAGHGVELNTQSLATQSSAVLATLTDRRKTWADRWVFTPIARALLPQLTARNIGGWAPTAAAAALSALALFAIAWNWEGPGLAVAPLATGALTTGAAMAALAGEAKRAMLTETAITALFAACTVSVGASERLASGGWTPLVLALVAVGCQIVVERAPQKPRRWWASPAAHLLLLTPFALAGYAAAGLAFCATYAFSTLAAAVEASREKA